MSAAAFAPPPAPAPAAAPQLAGIVRFERVEYGKVTTTPDGAIVAGVEHVRLGRSRGFPNRAPESCDPSVIGPIGSATDRRPDDLPHGTVLRPVLIDGNIVPIFCRERMRAEGGEGATGRRYTMARYLAIPTSPASPLAFFEGMEALPLRGLTQAELPDLLPIETVARQTPQLDAAGASFVRQAVIYVLSGVPVTITAPMPERMFFELAAAVWFVMPSALRPLFSAGWGVGASLSGTLTMTCCPTPSTNSAVFDTDGRWTAPHAVIIGEDSAAERPFEDARLLPGRMYTHYAFEWASDGPVVSELESSARAALLMRELPAFAFPPLPAMRDATVVRALRQPGLRAWDDHHLQRLSKWIRSGSEGVASASVFTFPEAHEHALIAAVEGLNDPATRGRAEEYLWLVLRANAATHAATLSELTIPGAARARLIALLARSADAASVLEALVDAIDRGEAADLSEAITARITGLWNRSPFGLRETELHCRLLASHNLPPFYVAWLREHAVSLMFAIATWRVPPWQKAVAVLERTSGGAAVAAIHAYLRGQMPDAARLAAIRTLPPADFASFAHVLSADWMRQGRDMAAHREVILAWVEACRPEPVFDNVLRFALNRADIAIEGVRLVANDVERGWIPRSILPAVSALALREWSEVGTRILQNRAAWAPYTSLWPAIFQSVLLDEHAPGAMTHPFTEEAARELEISSDEVQTLIERWLPRFPLQQQSTQELAMILWQLAIRARPALAAHRRCVELCQEIERGYLTPAGEADVREIELAVQLRQASQIAVDNDRRDAIWRSAVASWQIRLALELFPDSSFTPIVAQIQNAAHIADWMRAHLRIAARTNPGRVDEFRVAVADFHSLDFENQRGHWQSDFASSFLWGAFRRVPVDQQGSLRAALHHYGPDRRIRRELCTRYLAELSPASRQEGAFRVIRDYVVPEFLAGIPRAAVQALFDGLVEPPANRPFQRLLGRLRRAPRLRVEPDSDTPAVVELRGRVLHVPEGLFAWLREIGVARETLNRVVTEVLR